MGLVVIQGEGVLRIFLHGRKPWWGRWRSTISGALERAAGRKVQEGIETGAFQSVPWLGFPFSPVGSDGWHKPGSSDVGGAAPVECCVVVFSEVSVFFIQVAPAFSRVNERLARRTRTSRWFPGGLSEGKQLIRW